MGRRHAALSITSGQWHIGGCIRMAAFLSSLRDSVPFLADLTRTCVRGCILSPLRGWGKENASAASLPTLAKNARMGHPLCLRCKRSQRREAMDGVFSVTVMCSCGHCFYICLLFIF